MTFKKILVAINDSEPARWALQLATSIAAEQHGEICLLHVVNRQHTPPPEVDGLSTELLDELRQRAVELLSEADAQVGADIKRQRVIREGKPADEILAAARQLNSDLIILGTHGRSRLSHLLLGSTAEAVVRQASCPVLTVPKKPAPLQPAKSGNVNGKAAGTSARALTKNAAAIAAN